MDLATQIPFINVGNGVAGQFGTGSPVTLDMRYAGTTTADWDAQRSETASFTPSPTKVAAKVRRSHFIVPGRERT